MSEEQQESTSHQMQQSNKTNKDNSSTSVTSEPSTSESSSISKTNIHEMRNQEFVSRLMAATPPYLYSAPVGANNFFFSDMLRALVQNRNAENARNLQIQQQSVLLSKRPRKRSWSQHRPFYDTFKERKDSDEKPNLYFNNASKPSHSTEKPLELTNKTHFQTSQLKNTKAEDMKQISSLKSAEQKDKETSFSSNQVNIPQATPPAASLPPQDLILPPPTWYPSLYPPYGIDPLHFFIDFRVSGHIYDRKKENVSPLVNNAPNIVGNNENEVENNITPKPRLGSAFTVPIPRSNEQKSVHQSSHAINLSSSAASSTQTNITNKFEHSKFYDLGESKENHPISKNYMLHHLPRLYSQFAAQSQLNEETDDVDSDGADERSTNGTPQQREGDIDVESRCSSTDEASVTQID